MVKSVSAERRNLCHDPNPCTRIWVRATIGLLKCHCRFPITLKRYQRHISNYNLTLAYKQLYTPSRNLRSSNRSLLVKPYFNLNSYGKRAFSVAAPELWNNLPEDIKSANSIDDFKRKLKTFLFMRAYES